MTQNHSPRNPLRHTDHTNHRAAVIAVVGPVGMLMALLFAVSVYVYAYRCLAEDGNGSPGEGETGAEGCFSAEISFLVRQSRLKGR
jgi:hypothetical protein